MRDNYLKTAKEKIKRFSDYLGEKQWFVGDKVSWYTINYRLLSDSVARAIAS